MRVCLCGSELVEDQPEWPTSQKDAGGQCLQKERMRFVEWRWNFSLTCVPRERCRTTTAWISCTTSGPNRVTQTQVRLHNLLAFFFVFLLLEL